MKVHFSHDSKIVARQSRGTHSVFHVQRCWGWLGDCQKTYKWVCSQGHHSTECTYNVTIYSAFLCELMHLLSVSVKRTGLEHPHQLCDLEWVLKLPGLSFPMCEIGTELASTSQSHFVNIMKMKTSEGGWCTVTIFSGRFLTQCLLFRFQRLNLASCHCSYHMEGCSTPSADTLLSFPYLLLIYYHLLSSFNLLVHTNRLLLFWPWPVSLINPSRLSPWLQQLSWHHIQGTCVRWLELAHSLSLCVVPHPPREASQSKNRVNKTRERVV